MKRHPAKGFTLIELMITVVVISILTMIAYPSYGDYVRRSHLQEAFAGLSEFRMRMEQYFQDNRSYANAGACGAANPVGTNPRFAYACALDTTGGAPAGQSYRMTASGNGGSPVEGFVYTIDERNVRATTGMYVDWGSLPADANARWIDRKP